MILDANENDAYIQGLEEANPEDGQDMLVVPPQFLGKEKHAVTWMRVKVALMGLSNRSLRKQLQAEHGKADLEKRITELEAKKKKQSNKVIELKSKIEAIQSRNASRREVEGKKRQEEIKFLNYQATHLQRFLKQIEQK